MGWLKDLKVKAGQGWQELKDMNAAVEEELRDERAEQTGGRVLNGMLYLEGKVIPVNQITGVSLSPDGRQVSVETAGGTTVAEGSDAKNLQRQITNAMG